MGLCCKEEKHVAQKNGIESGQFDD